MPDVETIIPHGSRPFRRTMRFRERITVYNFILIMLVIWQHAAGKEGSFWTLGDDIDSGYWLREVLANGIASIAVPGFFCLSGLLFFRNLSFTESQNKMSDTRCLGTETTSISWPGWQFFLGKWQRRVKSLLIPFVFWNFVYYLIYLFFGRASLSMEDVLSGILFQKYNPVFWYIRELLVLTVLTPLVFLLIKSKVYVWIFIAIWFLLAVFYDILPFHPVNEDAFFYYICGSAAGVWGQAQLKRDGKENINFWENIVIIFTIILVFSLYLLLNLASGRWFDAQISYRLAIAGQILSRISGVSLVFALVSIVFVIAENLRQKKRTIPLALPGFMRCNFLIYALHYLEIRAFFFLLINLENAGLSSGSNGYEIFFFLMPIICVMITWLIDSIMRRFIPTLLKLITGGRE